MASERVQGILRSKGAPFDESQLESMPDAEGWRWIYGSRGAKRPEGARVCFTGFAERRRFELEDLARGIGFSVSQGVGPTLDLLVTGSAPGPAKLARAGKLGVLVLSEEDFLEGHVKPSIAARLAGTSAQAPRGEGHSEPAQGARAAAAPRVRVPRPKFGIALMGCGSLLLLPAGLLLPLALLVPTGDQEAEQGRTPAAVLLALLAFSGAASLVAGWRFRRGVFPHRGSSSNRQP